MTSYFTTQTLEQWISKAGADGFILFSAGEALKCGKDKPGLGDDLGSILIFL